MDRRWLTVLVSSLLAFSLLRVSAATEYACVDRPVPASDADDRYSGESVGEATVAGCGSRDSSGQISQVAFDRAPFYGDVQSLYFSPEPSVSALLGLGLANRALIVDQVSDVKPLIRRKPP
jgi:hypothetical protein